MTRMARTLMARLPLLALVPAFAAVGCADPKDEKIAQLTSERDALQKELDDRDRQLNDALVREEDAKRSIDELNQRLLAKLPETNDRPVKEQPDGWISQAGFDMISIAGSVLFDAGKSDLTRGGQKALDRIASDIRSRYPDRDIYVFGHTDDQPIKKSKWRDNWELGAHRSLAVIRFLKTAGISEDHLIQANCGQNRPRADGMTATARQQNRRVEFYAVEHKGGAVRATASSGME